MINEQELKDFKNVETLLRHGQFTLSGVEVLAFALAHKTLCEFINRNDPKSLVPTVKAPLKEKVKSNVDKPIR